MLCFNCSKPTFKIFCKKCENELMQLECKRRVLDDGLEVFSFYRYSKIKHLLNHKHYLSGYFILNKLAKLSFKRFDFMLDKNTVAIGLDDDCSNGYSHTAILLRHIKNIKPIFNALKAQNKIIYKGKSLSFRKRNKRKYYLTKEINSPVILVDDILTSGESMKEAKKVLKKHKIEVLFGVVLADAKV